MLINQTVLAFSLDSDGIPLQTGLVLFQLFPLQKRSADPNRLNPVSQLKVTRDLSLEITVLPYRRSPGLGHPDAGVQNNLWYGYKYQHYIREPKNIISTTAVYFKQTFLLDKSQRDSSTSWPNFTVQNKVVYIHKLCEYLLTHTQRWVSGPLSRYTAASTVTVDPESWITGEGNIQSFISEKHTAIF